MRTSLLILAGLVLGGTGCPLPLTLNRTEPDEPVVELPRHTFGPGCLRVESGVDFGRVPVGMIDRENVVIRNRCDVGGYLSTVRIVTPSASDIDTGEPPPPGSFFMVRPLGGVWLQPGLAAAVLVEAAPVVGGVDHAVLEISAAPDMVTDAFVERVALYVIGDGPALDVEPGEEIHLGVVPVGCSSTGRVRVVNRGNRPAEITLFELNVSQPEDYALTFPEEPGELPWTLEGGEALDIDVTWTAPSFLGDVAGLYFETSDPSLPYAFATVRSSGVETEVVTDSLRLDLDAVAPIELRLSEDPVPHTLDVCGRGRRMHDGWVYDDVRGAIVLEDVEGIRGELVTATYAVAVDCGEDDDGA